MRRNERTITIFVYTAWGWALAAMPAHWKRAETLFNYYANKGYYTEQWSLYDFNPRDEYPDPDCDGYLTRDRVANKW